MIRKIISVGFLVLLISGAFFVMDILPVMEVSANDPVWNVDHWESNGDWIIDGTTTTFLYTSDTIRVNGNLTVMSGFTLTLQNVVLEMNTTYDGQYNITVNSGGNLIIEDLDDDHTTTADASIVTNSAPINDFKYGFVVEGPTGYLELKNSELHECGWANSHPDWNDAGLNIQSANAIVTGNDISNNFRGLILHNTSATGITVSNNTIYDSVATGLWISKGSIHNHIADNEIYNNEFGIYINSSDNSQTSYILNNTLRSNLFAGIFMEYSSKFAILDNDVYQNSNWGIFITEFPDRGQ
jgi:parallel beta-helix repeat protein